jgi:hypothetical protein
LSSVREGVRAKYMKVPGAGKNHDFKGAAISPTISEKNAYQSITKPNQIPKERW